MNFAAVIYLVLAILILLQTVFMLLYEFAYRKRKANMFNALYITMSLEMGVYLALTFSETIGNQLTDGLFFFQTFLLCSIPCCYTVYLYMRSWGLLVSSPWKLFFAKSCTFSSVLLLNVAPFLNLLPVTRVEQRRTNLLYTYSSSMGGFFCIVLDIFYLYNFRLCMKSVSKKLRSKGEVLIIVKYGTISCILSVLCMAFFLIQYQTGFDTQHITYLTLDGICIALCRMKIEIDDPRSKSRQTTLKGRRESLKPQIQRTSEES
jgi:hypothetical protein